jgi:hypothetical protein
VTCAPRIRAGRRRHQHAGPAAALEAPDPHGLLGKRTFLHPT